MTTLEFKSEIFWKILHLVRMTKQELQAAKKKFGKNAQKIRLAKGMSLLDVSYNCNLLNGKISEIEHGKHNITLSTLLELAKGLDVPPAELLSY